MPEPEYLTVSQAAARLGVSERTIRRRCEAGTLAAKLETTDSGKTWHIEAAAIGADSEPSVNHGDTTAGAASSADAAAIVRPEEVESIRRDVDTLKSIVTTNMANQLREVLAELPNKADIEAAATAATAAAIAPILDELKSERERDKKQEVAAAVNEVLAPYISQLDQVAIENRALREQLAEERARRPFWRRWKG